MPATLTFQYLQPSVNVVPIDGNLKGGTTVTVTAYWGSVQNSINDITADWGGVTIPVEDFVTSSLTSTIVTFLVPPRKQPGNVNVILIGAVGDMKSSFVFEYFSLPEIFDIKPRAASLDGHVGGCSECLRNNDGKTLSMWIKHFPTVKSTNDVTVSFGSVMCGGDTATCRVLYTETFSEYTYLTVTVPPETVPGTPIITITYVGDSWPPLGASPTGSYTREARAASSSDLFYYFRPQPKMSYMAWCAECYTGPRCMQVCMPSCTRVCVHVCV